jgi:hypothetical protein
VRVAGASWRQLPALSAIPLLAFAIVGLGLILGWRGVDLPAQVYRVQNFRAHGLAPWDGEWFGGVWTLSYSVLFPPVAAAAGLGVVTVGAAAGAALAFDRLAEVHLGTGGRPAAIVFAVGTAVQSAIGQVPFLAGEALALAAVWALTRRRRATAAVLALGASLTSPLAGVFLLMAVAAWMAVSENGAWKRGAGVLLAAAAPLCTSALLFPGQGHMPYPFVDYAWELAVAAGLWVIAGPAHRAIRAGVLAFGVVATVAVLIPSPLGGNVGRLQDVLALPLAVGVLWPRRPLGRGVLLPLVAVPLVLSQWSPAWGALTTNAGEPSTQPGYFAPLVAALRQAAAAGPAGRVEVVPTEFHWETVYIPPVMAVARGWERQADEADNPLFYGADRLDAQIYRAWLLDNGVRFVALADAPLDFAGRPEGHLLGAGGAGPAGLRLVWRSAHWQLFAVSGSPGLVSAPARVLSAAGDRVVVSTPTAGPVLVRVRYNDHWALGSGTGCLAPAPAPLPVGGGGTWIRVQAPAAERFTLRLAWLPARDRCRAGHLDGQDLDSQHLDGQDLDGQDLDGQDLDR